MFYVTDIKSLNCPLSVHLAKTSGSNLSIKLWNPNNHFKIWMKEKNDSLSWWYYHNHMIVIYLPQNMGGNKAPG